MESTRKYSTWNKLENILHGTNQKLFNMEQTREYSTWNHHRKYSIFTWNQLENIQYGIK